MAQNDETWKKRRQKAEKEEIARDQNKSPEGTPGRDTTERVEDLIKRADSMIDQLNSLYQMFLSGVEKLPPNEKRKALDQSMASLQLMGKPNPSIQFRHGTLISKYLSYKDRWDKMLKDIELGKLKRSV